MARTDRPWTAAYASPTVHNAGSEPVGVRVVVHGDVVTATALTLDPGESHAVSSSRGDSIEIYTRSGSATAPAASGPLFVVRDGRVLVSPE